MNLPPQRAVSLHTQTTEDLLDLKNGIERSRFDSLRSSRDPETVELLAAVYDELRRRGVIDHE